MGDFLAAVGGRGGEAGRGRRGHLPSCGPAAARRAGGGGGTRPVPRLTALSAPPVARSLPSGEKARAVTAARWPVNSAVIAPERTSKRVTASPARGRRRCRCRRPRRRRRGRGPSSGRCGWGGRPGPGGGPRASKNWTDCRPPAARRPAVLGGPRGEPSAWTATPVSGRAERAGSSRPVGERHDVAEADVASFPPVASRAAAQEAGRKHVRPGLPGEVDGGQVGVEDFDEAPAVWPVGFTATARRSAVAEAVRDGRRPPPGREVAPGLLDEGPLDHVSPCPT